MTPHRLPSGAGHDGLAIAALCPIAMLFVRCKGGISHNPAKSITTSDADVATAVLLDFLRHFRGAADARPRPLWLRDPLAILAEGDAAGGIVVSGGRIVELVPAGGRPTTPDVAVFDASAHVVLPGLINTHHHFYQTLTRACPPALDKALFPWLVALYPIWARLTPETLRLAVRVALAELLLSGTTTTSDHHYVFNAALADAIDIEVEEARALGMRLVATRGSMSLGEDEGGLPPRTVVQREDAILADSERLIARHHEAGTGAMIQVALAPCSPFSVTESLMRDSAILAARHGVRLHTHLAETRDEEDWCRARFGCRPVDYLERVGWLDDRVWLAHGIWFDEAEIGRSAGPGRRQPLPDLEHDPGLGLLPVGGLEAAGAPVGLGVDGSASNDSSNLIETARHAFLLQRLMRGAEQVSHKDALRWATRGSAGCLGRSDIGAIAPGLQADLALYRLDELRFSGAGDPLAASSCAAPPVPTGSWSAAAGWSRMAPFPGSTCRLSCMPTAAPRPTCSRPDHGPSHGRRHRHHPRLSRQHRDAETRFLAELVKVPSDNPPGDCAAHAEAAAGCSRVWASRSSGTRYRRIWCAPTA